MSIRIMTAVWDLDLNASDKLVLLALADNANDDGLCWPGITSLVRKTGLCKRSLQEALRRLEGAGLIDRRENPGKGVFYTVLPVAKSAPVAISAPVAKSATGGVAKSAPKPSLNHQVSKSPCAWACPIGVEPQVWTDFLTNRKKKGLPNTETSWKALQATLERVAASSGILPTALIEHAAGAGWGGIYDPTGRSNGNGQGNQHRAAAGKSAAAYHALTAHLGDNEAF